MCNVYTSAGCAQAAAAAAEDEAWLFCIFVSQNATLVSNKMRNRWAADAGGGGVRRRPLIAHPSVLRLMFDRWLVGFVRGWGHIGSLLLVVHFGNYFWGVDLASAAKLNGVLGHTGCRYVAVVCQCPDQFRTLEEASTHKSVKTHACPVFVSYDLWPFDSDISRTYRGTFVCQRSVILAASVFEMSCGKTDRHTDKQRWESYSGDCRRHGQ